MMCYRDMTFCKDRCKTIWCHRNAVHLEEDRLNGKLEDWMPVAWASFADDCKEYEPEEPEAA